MKSILTILFICLACVALAGCHAKKLSYRDPFYFSDKQAHSIDTTDTTKRTGDWKTDVYSTGTTVLNNSTQSLYFRVMAPDSMKNASDVYSINVHIKPIGNNRFMYNYSCLSGDNKCFFIYKGDTIKVELIKLKQ